MSHLQMIKGCIVSVEDTHSSAAEVDTTTSQAALYLPYAPVQGPAETSENP